MCVVVDKISDLKTMLQGFRSEGKSIGFVPTMGALHKGHVSLVERSVAENDITVVSIFVNPTQFNDKNDLKNYPRMPEKDIAMLEAAGVNVVFMPTESEIILSPIPVCSILGCSTR